MDELAAASSAGAAASNVKLREPFKFRPELLAPERLAPNIQQLLRDRSRATEELAGKCFTAVLATAKCYAVSGCTDLPRVGVIGGGAVGCAVLIKLLVHEYPSSSLALSTRQPDRTPRCEALQQPAALALFDQVRRYDDNARLARESDVVVLCVPPSQLKGVAMQLKVGSEERRSSRGPPAAPLLVVSVLCGVTRANLVKASGSRAVVVVRSSAGAAGGGAAGLEELLAGLAELHGELKLGDQSARLGVAELLFGSQSEDLPRVSRAIRWRGDWQRRLEEELRPPEAPH